MIYRGSLIPIGYFLTCKDINCYTVVESISVLYDDIFNNITGRRKWQIIFIKKYFFMRGSVSPHLYRFPRRKGNTERFFARKWTTRIPAAMNRSAVMMRGVMGS